MKPSLPPVSWTLTYLAGPAVRSGMSIKLNFRDKVDLKRERGEEALKEAVYNAINRKPKGHDFIIDRRSGTKSVARHMNVTGG